MNLDKIHNVHFIGIGGIGMSALARWFMHYGKHVSGYDKTRTELTDVLESEGAVIHYEDEISAIPQRILNEIDSTLIVYTPAIPASHKELNHLKNTGFTFMKRSEVLGLISRDKFTIAVAGTHGKTTTSSMVAHLLYEGGISFTALIGGIINGYESNLIVNGDSPEIFVVEADEFDRSFLQLSPDIAIVTSMDPDHLDIYDNHDSLKESFNEFIAKVRHKLFYHTSLKPLLNIPEQIAYRSYGEQAEDMNARITHVKKGYTHFDLRLGQEYIDFELGMPGKHNVSNATAAIAAVADTIKDIDLIQKAIKSYQGVKRRFQYIINTEEVVFIDDYAHHPSEIEAFIQGVRSAHSNRSITIVFQPHLFTRTRDFADGFAESLSMADQVILLDIYPARELPIEGVNSTLILNKMTIENKAVCKKEDLLDRISQLDVDVLCTVGAGDIDQCVEPLKELLKSHMVC